MPKSVQRFSIPKGMFLITMLPVVQQTFMLPMCPSPEHAPEKLRVSSFSDSEMDTQFALVSLQQRCLRPGHAWDDEACR